jgi:hypothetical protein
MSHQEPPTPAPAETCLVLMFKSPARSKQRLAGEIGPSAGLAADLLLGCALEDLAAWPGPVCIAPAEPDDEETLIGRLDRPAISAAQGSGNLGQRINAVNAALWTRGIERQLLIGIDCPALDGAYLAGAARALDRCDAALGPAADGGAVVIGSRVLWPELGALPWSTSRLLAALEALARGHGITTCRLPERTDVDSAADLRALWSALDRDDRAARVALRRWVHEHAECLGPTTPA